MDDLITLNRAILDLHPSGHDGRVKSIDKFLLHLRKRRESFGMASDLAECVMLERIALGLHQPGDPGHATCHYMHRHLVDDLQCMLRKLENASDVLDSSDHTMFLHSLVTFVGGVASEGHVSMDSDEIVALAQIASRLSPFGYFEHVASLTALATCLQYWFQQHSNITDLDEAIILHKGPGRSFRRRTRESWGRASGCMACHSTAGARESYATYGQTVGWEVASCSDYVHSYRTSSSSPSLSFAAALGAYGWRAGVPATDGVPREITFVVLIAVRVPLGVVHPCQHHRDRKWGNQDDMTRTEKKTSERVVTCRDASRRVEFL